MIIRVTLTDKELTDVSYVETRRKGTVILTPIAADAWDTTPDKAESIATQIRAENSDIAGLIVEIIETESN